MKKWCSIYCFCRIVATALHFCVMHTAQLLQRRCVYAGQPQLIWKEDLNAHVQNRHAQARAPSNADGPSCKLVQIFPCKLKEKWLNKFYHVAMPSFVNIDLATRELLCTYRQTDSDFSRRFLAMQTCLKK